MSFCLKNMRSTLLLLFLVCSLGSFAQQEYRDSLAVAMEELSFHPDSVDLRLKKARWNIELGQFAHARAEYDYVLKLEPKNVAALYYRAYAFERLNRYSYARADYEDLLAIVPGHFEAQLGLALLNQKDHRLTEAMDQINRLVNSHPDRSEAFAARAGIEVERKMYDLAEYDFTEAIRLEPENVDYILARADLRITMGRKSAAREDLMRLLELGIPRPNIAHLLKKCK